MRGITSAPSPASFTSFAWIFLPRYSGVRPIIRPPMNTAMIGVDEDACTARFPSPQG